MRSVHGRVISYITCMDVVWSFNCTNPHIHSISSQNAWQRLCKKQCEAASMDWTWASSSTGCLPLLPSNFVRSWLTNKTTNVKSTYDFVILADFHNYKSHVCNFPKAHRVTKFLCAPVWKIILKIFDRHRKASLPPYMLATPASPPLSPSTKKYGSMHAYTRKSKR